MIFLTLRDFFNPDLVAFITQRHVFSSMVLLLVGAQIVEFGLAAQAFSFSKYFDYASKSIRFLHRYFRLEKGMLFGMLFVFLGLSIF